MSLMKLPEETFLQILLHLGLKDILAFNSVCRSAHALFVNSTRLQYVAELEAAGCLDIFLDQQFVSSVNNQEKPSIPERLKYPREREARWRELDLLKRAAKVPPPNKAGLSIYDLTGGVYACGSGARGSGLNFLDLREVSHRSEVCSNQAQGRERRLRPPKRAVFWQSFPFQENIVDFGMALQEHDLIAVVSTDRKTEIHAGVRSHFQDLQLHLLCFSTCLPHPVAKEPLIKLAQKPFRYDYPSPTIEVVGTYAIVLLKFPYGPEDAAEDLFAYNWKSGRLIAHLPFTKSTYTTLSFVTHTLFVMPNLQEHCLDLFQFRISPDNVEQLSRVGKLCLPRLVRGCKLMTASCRGDPNPTEYTPDCMRSTNGQTLTDTGDADWTPNKKWGASGYGISADPLKAIISFSLRYSSMAYSTNLVVHRSTLARLALTGVNSNERNSEYNETRLKDPMFVTAWSDWGQDVTRWRWEEHDTEWETTMAGQRQVYTALGGSALPFIIVRDYNPYNVQRMKFSESSELLDLYVESQDDERGQSLSVYRDQLKKGHASERPFHPFVRRSVRVRDTRVPFPAPCFRKGDVVSGLPCVESFVVGDSKAYSSLLMDEERIIGYLVSLSEFAFAPTGLIGNPGGK
ncbi:hypothetical protein M0805_008077 [Coniferiporia weirii]|nr:hypothetical protein M0805_008077 [Coniferiporia weirii]